MADKRPYAKIDVGYLSNPKIAALLDDNPRAVLLHLACINYGVQHATDGIVPLRIAMRIACGTQCDADLLMQCGLISDIDGTNVAVRDFLEHQRSSSEVKARSQAASLAAASRWDAERNADGSAKGNAERTANRNAEKERESTTSELRPDVARLLDRLDACIVANGAKAPKRTKANVDAARLLLDRDGHTEADVERIIGWATTDTFWKSNILSMAKLREKFDQLSLRAQSQPAQSNAYRPGSDMEVFW